MNATVAVVIVDDDETNISLLWTGDFPPVLLTDELNISDDQTQDKCNNFGRVALPGREADLISSACDSYAMPFVQICLIS